MPEKNTLKFVKYVDYELKEPINIGTKDGQFEEVSKFRLYAPLGEHSHIIDKMMGDGEHLSCMKELIGAGLMKSVKHDVTVNEVMLDSMSLYALMSLINNYNKFFLDIIMSE